jgi:hypothetical protein
VGVRESMCFNLTDSDDESMCRFVEQVLENYAGGEVSLREARSDLAHVMVLGAVGDEAAFKKYIRAPADERARV